MHEKAPITSLNFTGGEFITGKETSGTLVTCGLGGPAARQPFTDAIQAIARQVRICDKRRHPSVTEQFFSYPGSVPRGRLRKM